MLRNDAAENSIMQTITIAVSAILIAAGLVTAPGLINNARDNNAKTDLANIAYAQSFVQGISGQYYAVDGENTFITIGQEMAETGASRAEAVNNLQYVAENLGLNGLGTSVALADDRGGVSITLSGDVTGHIAATCDTSPYFLLKAQSDSGKWFYRGSGSALTSSDVNDILSEVPSKVTTACPSFGDGFEETEGSDPGNDDDETPVVVPDYANYAITNSVEATSYSGAPIPELEDGIILTTWDLGADRLPWTLTHSEPESETWASIVSDVEIIIANHAYTDINSGEIEVFHYRGELDDEGTYMVGLSESAVLKLVDDGALYDFVTDGWISLTLDGVEDNVLRNEISNESMIDYLYEDLNIPLPPDPQMGGSINTPMRGNYGIFCTEGMSSNPNTTWCPNPVNSHSELFITNYTWQNGSWSSRYNGSPYDRVLPSRMGDGSGEVQVLSAYAEVNGGAKEQVQIVLDNGYVFYGASNHDYTWDEEAANAFWFEIRSESNLTVGTDGQFDDRHFEILDMSNNSLIDSGIENVILTDVQVMMPGATQPMWIRISWGFPVTV